MFTYLEMVTENRHRHRWLRQSRDAKPAGSGPPRRAVQEQRESARSVTEPGGAAESDPLCPLATAVGLLPHRYRLLAEAS